MGKPPTSQAEGTDFELTIFCTPIIASNPGLEEHVALWQHQYTTCYTLTLSNRYNIHQGTDAQYPNDLHMMQPAAHNTPRYVHRLS